MATDGDARWWAWRPARTLKPATYTCPLCGGVLHAMSEHLVVAPEGDASRRRHAHTDCVRAARAAGAMRSREEWRREQPAQPSALRRLFGRPDR